MEFLRTTFFKLALLQNGLRHFLKSLGSTLDILNQISKRWSQCFKIRTLLMFPAHWDQPELDTVALLEMMEGCTFSGRGKKGIINRTDLVKICLAVSDSFSSAWWDFFHQLDIDVKVSKLRTLIQGCLRTDGLGQIWDHPGERQCGISTFPSVGLVYALC